MRLVRAELVKIRTTNAWWLFTLTAVVLAALTFLLNLVNTNYLLDHTDALTEGLGPEQQQAILAQLKPDVIAANLGTSGQFFGLLIVLVMGVMVATTEFFHQTVTTTFMTTPHRSTVIGAKLVASALLGALIWLVTSALTIPATLIYLASRHLDAGLGDASVLRAYGLNLLAYVLWAIFGVGFGVLLRSQIAATVTAIILYLAGYIGALIIFSVLENWLGWEWIQKLQVIVPSLASQLMVTNAELPGSPPQWLGAVVLIAYAAVSGVVGTLIVRTRDVS
ncbi:ABC transporter permease subunit [Rhizomonospora bruguierae]|uniref:ABC transporter permease subunit n=1 Tax=Rhizomonospora bruguierae TaxID=1581705 RepID=UPI001BCF2EA5|nr:ABC transporter permease subunit [Micromonospora sp. NBRC 107566]